MKLSGGDWPKPVGHMWTDWSGGEGASSQAAPGKEGSGRSLGQDGQGKVARETLERRQQRLGKGQGGQCSGKGGESGAEGYSSHPGGKLTHGFERFPMFEVDGSE